MQPTPLALLLHPFADILDGWMKGAPVDCGQPWSMEAIMVVVTWGAHLSTMTVEAIHLIHKDIDCQVQAGFRCIVDWAELQQQPPPNLKVSLVVVVPQEQWWG